MRLDFTRASAFRFTEKSKAIQIQSVGSVTSGNPEESDTSFSDAFSEWCIVAPPYKPDVDASGNIGACCECITADIGDDKTVIGTRDVRASKYAQDVKGGEVALVNYFGSRLFLGEKFVSINAGGGYLGFDTKKGTVGLVGIPSSPGGSAPYLSISSTTIGLVSATGASSFTIDGGNITLSGSGASLNTGSVNLGMGASDPVVRLSDLVKLVAALKAQFAAHTHPVAGALAGVTTQMLTLAPTGSLRVKSA